MDNMNEKEMASIGAMVGACMEDMGLYFGRSKGAKALFCIACCGAMCEKEARPWSAAGMAHEYAAFIGSTQTAVWQSIWRALQRAKWTGKVSEAIYGLAGWGAEV